MILKEFAFCLYLSLLCVSSAWAQELHMKRKPVSALTVDYAASETLVAQIGTYPVIRQSFKVSPDNRHVGYAARKGEKQFIAVDPYKERNTTAYLLPSSALTVNALPTQP